MKNNKVYILIIIVFIVFGLIMYMSFGRRNLQERSQDTTIIVGENAAFRYVNRKWVNLSNSSKLSELNWNQFNTYSNGEYVGDYYLWYDDKWYAFDKDKNSVNVDGDLFAIKSNTDISLYNFTYSNIEADEYVYQVLKDNDIGLTSKFTALYKGEFDFDSDGVEESFYIMSNIFPTDFTPSHIFNIAFMVKDGQIYNIYNSISDGNSYNTCKPYYNTFLDYNNDNTYEFILTCAKFSDETVTHMLYKYDNGEFKIAISN